MNAEGEKLKADLRATLESPSYERVRGGGVVPVYHHLE